jgi:hypothetical protein
LIVDGRVPHALSHALSHSLTGGFAGAFAGTAIVRTKKELMI